MRGFLNWIRKLILLVLLIVSGLMLLHIVVVTLGTHFMLWNHDTTPFHAALLTLVYYIVPLTGLLLVYLMISELIYIEEGIYSAVTNAVSERAIVRAETKAAIAAIKEAKEQAVKEAKERQKVTLKTQKETQNLNTKTTTRQNQSIKTEKLQKQDTKPTKSHKKLEKVSLKNKLFTS